MTEISKRKMREFILEIIRTSHLIKRDYDVYQAILAALADKGGPGKEKKA